MYAGGVRDAVQAELAEEFLVDHELAAHHSAVGPSIFDQLLGPGLEHCCEAGEPEGGGVSGSRSPAGAKALELTGRSGGDDAASCGGGG
jgi:hypothetical protein